MPSRPSERSSTAALPNFLLGTPALVCAILALAHAHAVRAQLPWGGGAAVGAAVPVGEFATHGPDTGFVFDFAGRLRLGSLPLSAGANLGFALFWPFGAREAIAGYPDVYGTAVSEPRILLAHLVGRAQWPTGDYRPFLEGRFGFKTFITETHVTLENERTGAELPVSHSEGPNGTRMSFGMAIGIDICVVDHPKPEGASRGYLSFIVTYLGGDRVGYLQSNSAHLRGGDFTVDSVQTRTDLLMLEVGMTFGEYDL